MSTMFDPYSRDVVREVLHGHLGLLDSIEPEDDALPCGEVVGTQREGDGLVVSVRWDGSNRECTYVLSVEAAPPEKDNDTDIAAPGDAAPKPYTEPPPRPTGSNLAGRFVKECSHCSGDGFEPMTGKWRESHACSVCGGDGEVASSIEGTS